jgi:putative hydrolase of the HAD superfamily
VITAVVFDLDGVLCSDRRERRLKLLASWSGQSPDAIDAAIWRSGFEAEVATEPNVAVLSLAREVGAGHPIGMFTNNPLLLKRHLAEVFPAAAEIFGTRAVFSAELGLCKPDPAAFRGLAAIGR